MCFSLASAALTWNLPVSRLTAFLPWVLQEGTSHQSAASPTEGSPSKMLLSPMTAKSSPSAAAFAAASAQASSLQQSPGAAIARRVLARQSETASQHRTVQHTICDATPHAAALAESAAMPQNTPLHTPLASHLERLLHRLNTPQDMAAASLQPPSLSQETPEPRDGAHGALEGSSASSAAKDRQNPLFDSPAVADGVADEFASPALHSSSPAQEALMQRTAALEQAQLSIECLQREVQDARDEARRSRVHALAQHTAAGRTAARHCPPQASGLRGLCVIVTCIEQVMEAACMMVQAAHAHGASAADREALEVSRVECAELCRQLREMQEQLTDVRAQLASAQRAPLPLAMPSTASCHTLLHKSMLGRLQTFRAI